MTHQGHETGTYAERHPTPHHTMTVCGQLVQTMTLWHGQVTCINCLHILYATTN